MDTSFWKPPPGSTCLNTCSGNLVLLGKRFLETLKTVPEIRACKTCSWEPCLGTLLGNLFLETSSWEPLLGKLFLRNLLGNLFLPFLGALAWEPLAGNPCLGTLAWEPVPGNLAWNLLGTLPGNFFLGTMLGNLFLGTSCWEPLLGNLFLVALPGNLARNLLLGTLLGNLFLGTLLGTLAWEPVPGNFLGALLGNLFLGTLLGNLFPGTWEPLPGNPVPNLALCGFGCSAVRIWLLRPAPEPLLWLKGKICSWISCLGNVAWKP